MPRHSECKSCASIAYDLRLARSLIVQGVIEFAAVNVKDFADVGFKRVFNPIF